MASHVADLVYLAWYQTEDDRAHLAEELFQKGRQSYEEAIRQQLQALGCDDGRVYLDANEELSWLRNQAEMWSTGIVQTFNQDLRRAVNGIEEDWIAEKGSTYGLNRHIWSHRIGLWFNDRQTWKTQQIDITEATRVYDHAILQFAKVNSSGGTAHIVPGSAVCAVCQSMIAEGEVPLSRAEQWILPVHVSCPHTVEVTLIDAPPCDELWRGQQFGELKSLREKASIVVEA